MTPMSLGMGLSLADYSPRGGIITARGLPGDTAALGATTFTRADATACATYINNSLVLQTVAANIQRNSHYVDGVRTILLESSRVNPCLQSEDFGVTWIPSNAPTRVPGADVASGVSLDLIGDASAVTQSSYAQAVVLSGDGVQVVSVFVKKGLVVPTSSTVVNVTDMTQVIETLDTLISWVGTVPAVAMTIGTYLGFTLLAGNVYRLDFLTLAMVAANVNRMMVIPARVAGGDIGNIYEGGFCVARAAFARSYIKTTVVAVTQATDALSFAGSSAFPGASTLFYRYWDLATRAWVNIAAAYTPGDPIVPPVDRAYADIAVLRGSLSTTAAAQAMGY